MTELLRALADSTRRRILTSLQGRTEAVTVDEVAAAQGIHRTVAFEHLELLARLGLHSGAYVMISSAQHNRRWSWSPPGVISTLGIRRSKGHRWY
jgi:predicted ArsR family transcriptional regulator